MKVAITTKQLETEYGSTVDCLEIEYTKYYSQFGITLIPIPNSLEDPAKFLEELQVEGIILTGGNGVHPNLYGEEIKYPNKYSLDREKTEKAIVDYASNKKLPILGVCRGLHYLNVHFGGKLLQSIKDQTSSQIEHVAKNHTINLINLPEDSAVVNSFHNQGITPELLSPQLKSFATCADGTIEAAYHPELPIAAITWHPERKSPDENFNKKLVQAFVNKELFWTK